MESDIQKTVKKGEGFKSPSSKSVEEIAKNIEDKLEALRGQYESQLESLRSELDTIKGPAQDEETDSNGGVSLRQKQYKEAQEKLSEGLAKEQREQLESLVAEMDKNYQQQIAEIQEKHVDDIESQVKEMRGTLEEIYNSQLQLVNQSNQVALAELRDTLDKEHREEIDKLGQEWDRAFEDLKQDYDRELRESKLGDSLGKEDSQRFISELNRKLTEEHRQILKKIEDDLEKDSASHGQLPRKRHTTHDTQTESEVDDAESVLSAPVTQEEFDHLEEREKVLGKTEDVRKTLESQYDDIVALRTQMLNEYEQLLSVRTDVMASQTEEVEKLQEEMASIQRQYEEQMSTFQTKVEEQTEAAMRAKLSEEHQKEVTELKQFYESKVSKMEEQLQSLQHDAGAQPTSAEKERDYVRKTTMLTAISDTEESPPPSPPRSPPPQGDRLEGKINSLEEKLKDRDKLIDELKKRLEIETASAEDLHGQLLDSNNKLCEFEDNLKTRGEELEELKAALTQKDSKIASLENEKAEIEERGEKEIESKIISELKQKIAKIEEELSASKEAENAIRKELDQLNSQHQEAIIALKHEMENINKNKVIELESEFKIQLEQELDKQAKEITNKYIVELEAVRNSETDLKQKLESAESSHEKEVSILRQDFEKKMRDSLVTSTVTDTSVKASAEPETHKELIAVKESPEREAGSPILPKKSFIDGVFEKFDRDTVENSVRAEILQEYEDSIDRLKAEYEDRISELNSKLQSYETQGAQQPVVIDDESVPSKVESSIREKLKVEIAKEYKEKLQNVTDDYENKLKQLKEQIELKGPVTEELVFPSEAQPSETSVKSPTEKTPGKIPKEYEGYVSTIRKDYEDKIVSLQTEIAQYKSSSVPSPMSPKLTEPESQTLEKDIRVTADAGQDVDPVTVKLRQEIRAEISAEYESQLEHVKSEYEKQIEELHKSLDSSQTKEPIEGETESKIRKDLSEEYDKKLTQLETECESKIEELKQKLEQAMGEKMTAEQKVKADMFVWHEELVTQLKRKHVDNIAQINKEYEEKMDLLREELQEEFDAEKDKISRQHKQDMLDYEDRYENLLEGLRSGDAPDVAAIVQEKFDMELEMAKTLIQQECEETIESEQSRLSEQHEYEVEKLLAEKEEALEEQATKYNKDMTDLRNTLLQQYEAQILEMTNKHEEAMTNAKQEFDSLVEKVKSEARETAEQEKESPVTSDSVETVVETLKSAHEDQEPDTAETELVGQLRQDLAEKAGEYTAKIAELKAIHEEEISQLMKDLEDKDSELDEKLKELEEKHVAEVAEYQEKVEQLQQDVQKAGPAEATTDDTEALELAHQQELHDLEDRLTDKHRKELDNLETQFKSRLEDMGEKHKLEVETLRNELLQAQQALDQYPDIQEEVMSPVQAVPTFHAADSTLGSTQETSLDDFMVPTQTTSTESQPGTKTTSLKGTEAFEAQIIEDKTISLQGTLDDTGLQSLDTEQTPRGSLRGVDDTIESSDLMHFSEEDEEGDESEKSETTETKTDRSTPTELMQTMGYGTVITGGPTVKSLDDTSESSVRASDREEQSIRIRELEVEVEDLRKKLQYELSKQDVQLDRLDREKQEESNLVAMLQVDIERLNSDREVFQNTNEHLLGLLSDAVKTYMNIDDSISKKLKSLMERPADKSAEGLADRSGGSGRPASADGKRPPTPTRRSPHGRQSPAREDGADGDNAQNTSVTSNVTDEGLDLSQRISDSIFQGPDLASEEEELLQDAGSRLQSSVAKLLEMIEESTNQLLDTKQTQDELMVTLDSRGHDLDQHTSRLNDLEERLREAVEQKDFLALELHKAEGLIEGYSSERDQLDHKIEDLEEQKENLVLELETVNNKLRDMDTMQEENAALKKEIADQQELMSSNVGEEAQALMLEVTRLHSENREKEHHIKQVQDRYESRVRDLETSGEDMEGHYFKLLDDKKQEAADLRMQVDALEKQLKAKKQFIEEQANEREQEHEDYQKELDKWKKIVQDIEKQNGSDKRLQTEIDDLQEQLQNRIDLLKEAQLTADKYQTEVRDKDLSITELKAIIQQLEAEIQDKMQEAETNKQKLEDLEQELSRRPYPDDDGSEGSRSDLEGDKKSESLEYLSSLNGQKTDRVGTQISVEDELRLAADKTKEDIVREKHALQVQVNDLLKQISGLRNQLDEMRHRADFSDPSEATKRLQTEREKSEEKDKEISELKLQVESLGEQVENREQQIHQLSRSQTSVDRGEEYKVVEAETQLHALKAENKQLRERVQLASQTSSVTDISGLSQNLLEEKNQEIDHLSEQVTKLTTELQELKSDKGVEHMYDELESLREELKQKEKDFEDMQSVKVSQAFTDHSITPDSSIMNVRASYTEKASILQEMEESEAARLQQVANLEAELQSLKTTLQTKEEEIVTLKEEAANKKLVPGQEDPSLLQEIIDEKEQLILQLTEQTEGLQVEMENLSDFQTKLQEDFDTVQVMLEDKEREIEQLTKELTDRSPTAGDEHAIVIKHEVEISRLKKQLREKDNVIEEKLEELAEISDKVETYEIDIQKYKDSETVKEGEIIQLKQQLDAAVSGQPPAVEVTEEERKTIIQEQKIEIENLKQSLESALGRPPSPPLTPPPTESENITLIKEQKEEIVKLKDNLGTLLGRSLSPSVTQEKISELVKQHSEEMFTLREQAEAASLGRPPTPPFSEDEKMAIIKQQKLELETMRRQVDAALLIKPPSPPRSEDDKSEIIFQQDQEIKTLRKQVEAALQIAPPPPPMTEDEKDRYIERKEEEVVILKRELDQLGEAISSGGEEQLLRIKVQEVLNLHTELNEIKEQHRKVSEGVEIKDKDIERKESEIEKLTEDVLHLKEELQSVQEVKAYEDEMELKEKDDEIEQLQSELETYRSKDGSLDQTELGESKDSRQLERSMSFYKDQYEEKCSEARQLQVSLDLAKEQLEKLKEEQTADLSDELELLRVEIENEKIKEIKTLEEIKETLETEMKEKDQEIEDLKREITLVKERMGEETESKFKELELELEKARDIAAKERKDSVDTLKEMEEFREKKEKDRKESMKTIQQLERDLDEKSDIEKKLNKQIKQLNEELSQYRVVGEPLSPGSFEIGKDVETLQKQVETFKKQADKTKEVLAEKQKYQSQVIELEIKVDALQRQMRKGVSDLEGQMKAFASQPDPDVWEQLKITQDRLDKTSQQLSETAERLSETEGKLTKVSRELASREEEVNEVQQDLWKTSGLLSITSGKLQETEEKLRQTVALVTEREDQIHQLQGELQDAEKVAKIPSPRSPTQTQELDKLRQQLNIRQTELEQVKQSLKEAVEMNEQQLQMTEQKDQEFVKLKLEIQQTIADKDKTIKEQKHKLKGLETKEQEMGNKERQMEKMKQETQQALATKDRQIGKLREDAAQLQNQLQELRLMPDGAGDGVDTRSQVQNLESALKEKEKEVEHFRHQETALQKELTKLKQELDSTRPALKASDPKVKDQGQSDREGGAKEGISDEAEKHLQQLRRELLIAKTALIQIQRGEGFDRERSPVEEEAQALVQEVMARPLEVRQQETVPGSVRLEQLSDLEEVSQLRAELKRTREELELFRNSSSLSAQDFVQKVMDLKDELSTEHQHHIDDISTRTSQDTETQLAQMRIKYEDEIEQLKKLHGKELDQKLREQLNTLERKHKSEMNKLVLRSQEQIELLKMRAGPDIDMTGLELVDRLQGEVSSTERLDRQQLGERQDGVGQDRSVVNGQLQPPTDGISSKLQTLLRRLHNEGVQVLTISELQYLNRSLSTPDIPRDADLDSLKAGWENERQSYLSTIQSLKDLLAQTHKLRGLDKDDDEEDQEDDWLSSIEGSDWRAELLRAIGYVFSKERDALLAELRSHVLSHPDASLDEVQKLEQKIRNQEAHHHSAMDQIFSADRQSMLAEIRDLRAHATISRMHFQEERERLNDKLANTEDSGTKKERQLKRQDSDNDDDDDDDDNDNDDETDQTDDQTSSTSDHKVQLLEFKIQQEKVLQDDLRTSLDTERARSGALSGQLSQEKSSNLDLQSNISALQVQVGKLKETLEREQSRFVSVTNALEEEKAKSLNLSELLESERQTLYRVQGEVESLRHSQESLPSRRHFEELQAELNNERDRRCQADSQHEIDRVTIGNLQQEVEMEKRHQKGIQKEYEAKVGQLQRNIDNEKQKVQELSGALDRELTLTRKLRQSLETEKSQQEATGRERKMIEGLQVELEAERVKVRDLNNALQREHRRTEEALSSAEADKRLLQEHLDQEREVNHHLKHDLDALQIEKLEALGKFDKEHDHLERLKAEKDQMNEELKNLRTLELQRDQDRENERQSDKKAVRQADREKEEFRMKLHEQELETQRLSQKCLSLEEQISELQENELKAIRELEQEKLRNMQVEEEAKQKEAEQPPPEPDGGEEKSRDLNDEQRERLQVYRSQLESMCQSLHYLVLRCREQLSKSTHGGSTHSDVVDFDALHSSLRELLNEVKQLQELEGDFMSHPSGSVNERILRHNEELTNFVARSSEEKNELRNALSRLEEEIWQFRQKDARYQEIQRASSRADESLLTERAQWAKERLSLQMSLNTAEREIDQLQTDLRVERERRVASGITDTKETDKIKIQRLYGKYLRAESFRKALIYQKKYLLLLLGGFQDTEETTLSLLARMGATSAIESLHHRHYKLSPVTMFRSAVRVVIAITRMQYLVRKWKRATRVESEVVGGTVDQVNGYMPDSGSFSPPRHPASPRFLPSTAHQSVHPSTPPRLSLHQTPPRLSDPLIVSSRSQLEVDTFLPSSYTLSRGGAGSVHTTPPTKDYSSTTKYTSPSSGARRKILTTPQTQLSRPGRSQFTPHEETNGDYRSHDDYINRLENLQTRLGNLQNGKKPTWRQAWR